MLQIGGKGIDLPIVVGTEQERGIDISKLLATTGCVTLDEGYANTGATTAHSHGYGRAYPRQITP